MKVPRLQEFDCVSPKSTRLMLWLAQSNSRTNLGMGTLNILCHHPKNPQGICTMLLLLVVGCVHVHVMNCSEPALLKHRNICFSSKQPLNSAEVHSRKSKDQSSTFVYKHWCHPPSIIKEMLFIPFSCIW